MAVSHQLDGPVLAAAGAASDRRPQCDRVDEALVPAHDRQRPRRSPTSHSRTVPSKLPLATSWLSSLSATPRIPAVWPWSVATACGPPPATGRLRWRRCRPPGRRRRAQRDGGGVLERLGQHHLRQVGAGQARVLGLGPLEERLPECPGRRGRPAGVPRAAKQVDHIAGTVALLVPTGGRRSWSSSASSRSAARSRLRSSRRADPGSAWRSGAPGCGGRSPGPLP